MTDHADCWDFYLVSEGQSSFGKEPRSGDILHEETPRQESLATTLLGLLTAHSSSSMLTEDKRGVDSLSR